MDDKCQILPKNYWLILSELIYRYINIYPKDLWLQTVSKAILIMDSIMFENRVYLRECENV